MATVRPVFWTSDRPTWRPGTVERAFQLAASGDCDTIDAIEQALLCEHYEDVGGHLSGKLIRDQLRRAIAPARDRQP